VKADAPGKWPTKEYNAGNASALFRKTTK